MRSEFHEHIQVSQNRVSIDGPIRFCLTEANHCFCEGMVTINGKSHKFTTHLYFNGSMWVTDSVYKGGKVSWWHDIYLNRPDFEETTDNAKTRCQENLPWILNKVLLNYPDIDSLRQVSELDLIEHKRNNLKSSIDEMLSAIEDTRKELQNWDQRFEAVSNGELPSRYQKEK